MKQTDLSLDLKIRVAKMKLSAFRLINFKAFDDSGWVKINRVTLLLGENSSGKSALCQALQLVSYGYEKMMREDYFTNLAHVADELGNFEDLCYKAAKEPIVKIGFRFSNKEEELEYWVHLGRDKEGLFGQVIKVLGIQENRQWNFLQYYDAINIFFLKRKENTEIPGDVSELASCLLAALRQFSKSFQVITAHRYQPQRFMQLTGVKPGNIGLDGSNTYEMLYALSEIRFEKASMTEAWLEKFGYSYYWKMAGVNRGEFMLRELKSGMESNLVDNGFGISQSLPLALALDTLKSGEILMVDSPEAFLQTKMQSEMGDLLVEGSQKGSILVETGSEYLTLRIRRRVAEGEISKGEVSIYFLEEMVGGKTNCVPVELDENGEFINPSNQFMQFFSSDFQDIERLDEIRRKKYAAKDRNRYEHLGEGNFR